MKKVPKMELDLTGKRAMNLAVLQKINPNVLEIIADATHVALYSFEAAAAKWERMGIEGACFVTRCAQSPFYNLFVLNKMGDEDFVIDLKRVLNLKLQPPYVMLRYSSPAATCIVGLWFHDDAERASMRDHIEKAMQGATASSSPSTSLSSSPGSGSGGGGGIEALKAMLAGGAQSTSSSADSSASTSPPPAAMGANLLAMLKSGSSTATGNNSSSSSSKNSSSSSISSSSSSSSSSSNGGGGKKGVPIGLTTATATAPQGSSTNHNSANNNIRSKSESALLPGHGRELQPYFADDGSVREGGELWGFVPGAGAVVGQLLTDREISSRGTVGGRGENGVEVAALASKLKNLLQAQSTPTSPAAPAQTQKPASTPVLGRQVPISSLLPGLAVKPIASAAATVIATAPSTISAPTSSSTAVSPAGGGVKLLSPSDLTGLRKSYTSK